VSKVRQRTPFRVLLICFGLFPLEFCSIDVHADSPTREHLFRPRIKAGKPPDTPNRLSEHWWYGGQIELELERTRDSDLDSGEEDDTVSADPNFQFALAYRSDSWLSGFLDVELGKVYLLEDPDGQTSRSTRLDVVESWLQAESNDGRKRLRLGRQDFEDERTWLWDEELDGGRAYFELAAASLELSLTRRNLFSRGFLNGNEDDRINNYLALARFENEDEDQAILYALYRDSRKPDGEDLLFAGLQSVGELSDEADYWLNVSGVVGDSAGDNVRGFGLDSGLVYSLDKVLEPSVTLGIAYGSREFAQTGLHDNKSEMSGVTDFKYYGHALDPELSNLLIVTLDLGVKPTARSSLELVYHYYRQASASSALRDSSIDVDPDGEHRELGQALDLVFGYAAGDNLEFKLATGWFFPGPAFENDASATFFGGLEFIYQF